MASKNWKNIFKCSMTVSYRAEMHSAEDGDDEDADDDGCDGYIERHLP